MTTIRFNEMTTAELQKAFSVMQCQNLSQMRDYTQKMHFLNRGTITKKKLIENLQDIHQFSAPFSEIIIESWLNFALIQEDARGILKVCTNEDWQQRDETILNNRENNQPNESAI